MFLLISDRDIKKRTWNPNHGVVPRVDAKGSRDVSRQVGGKTLRENDACFNDFSLSRLARTSQKQQAGRWRHISSVSPRRRNLSPPPETESLLHGLCAQIIPPPPLPWWLAALGLGLGFFMWRLYLHLGGLWRLSTNSGRDATSCWLQHNAASVLRLWLQPDQSNKTAGHKTVIKLWTASGLKVERIHCHCLAFLDWRCIFSRQWKWLDEAPDEGINNRSSLNRIEQN